MTYYILSNPKSGNKRGAAITAEVEEYLIQHSVDFETFSTRQAADEKNRIDEILEVMDQEKDSIIIIGGDGTLSLSIDYLPKDLPFSYIPAGSGNDFARAINIPVNEPIITLEGILKGNSRDIYIMNYKS